MYSKIKIAGHPIHPMLVGFPVAFYTATMVCYLVYNANADVFWFKVAYVANAAGVATALLAALPGFIDWLGIPSDVPAKKTGVSHMICNVLALLLFGFCFLQQKDKWNELHPQIGMAIILSVGGFILTLIAGFLGWTLVQKHHVGIEP
jgi:uncharacterized membrane protein